MRGCSRFSLQTTHILRAYNVLSIHGWSQVKPAENYDVVYEQPQRPWDVNMVSPQKQTPLLRSWGPWKNLARPRHGIFESMWWGKVFFFSKYSYCRILKLGILFLLIFFEVKGALKEPCKPGRGSFGSMQCWSRFPSQPPSISEARRFWTVNHT